MPATSAAPLWPAFHGPEDLRSIEAVPLGDRGLPETSFALAQRAAELWPDRPATTFLGTAEPTATSFSELFEAVSRAANVLASAGVTRRDAVALISVNCHELHVALLASEAAGIAAPINPALSTSHATALALTAGAKVIVAAGPELDPRAWETARAVAAAVGAHTLLALRPNHAGSVAPALEPLPGTTVEYLSERTAAAAPAFAGALPEAGDLASYLHTGGTTGAPKLAARTHANEVGNAWMGDLVTAPADDVTTFAALPMFHTNALIVTMLAPLLRGRHVLWAGPLGYRDPALISGFWRLVQRHRIGAMSAVPTVYAALSSVPVDADIGSLETLIVGAAPLPPSVAEQFKGHTGRALFEGYGLTEGTCASCVNSRAATRPGTVGLRLPYQQIRAARQDPVTGAWSALPAGVEGTLMIKGPNVFAGYLPEGPGPALPDASCVVFDGWLDTGDRGSVDEQGFVRLSGRDKDVIIRGGHNIDPATIEDALLQHPEVVAACAVGQPDAHAGEVPVAYVVVGHHASTSPAELVLWAAERVPERAAAPKEVRIIDAVPLTAVGKPYKPELRRHATETAARKALPDRAQVHGELVDGTCVVTVKGVAPDIAAAALAPYAFSWKMA